LSPARRNNNLLPPLVLEKDKRLIED